MQKECILKNAKRVYSEENIVLVTLHDILNVK